MERLTAEYSKSNEQRKRYEKRLEQGYPRNIPEERYLKLARYEDLEEQGKLIELPCKVGDKLYEPTNRNTISVYIVTSINYEGYPVLFIRWELLSGFINQSGKGIYADKIGKTVFLTEEEAKKNLKEKESGKQ